MRCGCDSRARQPAGNPLAVSRKNVDLPAVNAGLLCAAGTESAVIYRQRRDCDEMEGRIIQQILSLTVVLYGDVGREWRGHRKANENKMSDGGRARASLGVGMWKSSEMQTRSGPPFAPSPG